MAKAIPATIWNTAIAILDHSELEIRDVIERDLADVAGLDHLRIGEATTAANNLMKKIRVIRIAAFKKAFRYIRDNMK